MTRDYGNNKRIVVLILVIVFVEKIHDVEKIHEFSLLYDQYQTKLEKFYENNQGRHHRSRKKPTPLARALNALP